MSKQIGQLNGPWAILLKASLILMPLVCGWGIWTTTSIFQLKSDVQLSAQSRFTAEERKQIIIKLENLDQRMAKIESLKIPPEWFELKVNSLQTDVTAMKEKLNSILVIIAENQTMLKTHVMDEKKTGVVQ